MTKQKIRSKFWLIYGIATAACVIAISVFLVIFYDIMASYEAPQPTYAAECFAASLTEEKLSKLASSAVDELHLKYENADSYVKVFTDSFDPNSVTCRKVLTESATDTQVFSVICKDTELLRLTLERSGGGKYGFDLWSVSSAVISLDGIIESGKAYTVYVPVGSELTVNGFTPEVTEQSVIFPISSELEDAVLPECDFYELGTLYSEPELICRADGVEFSYIEHDGDIIYLSQTLASQSYTVSAPTGAEVYVNGVLLGDSYITERDIPCKYSPIEKDKEGLPTYTVYATGELFSAPVITASLNGETLAAKTDGSKCDFDYPESLTYTLSVKVPTGAVVSVGDTPLTDISEVSEESVLAGLDTGSLNLPMLDVYTLTGLYTSSHNVTATLDGVMLTMKCETDGNTLRFTADHSSVIDADTSKFALDFVKAYFNYTSMGYNNTAENLDTALAYVLPGSELYSRIKNSKIGYDYVTPVTSEVYRLLEVSEMYRLADGTFAAKVVFDVDQTVVYVKRTYKGEISLHITGTGDNMKIRDMVIVSE